MLAKLELLNKTYFTSAGTFTSNDKTSISLNKGEVLMITNQSSYSKKTLLTIMGCLIDPNVGIIEINGKSCKESNLEEIASIKSQSVSFIFQYPILLYDLNVEENVSYSLRIQNIKEDEIKQRTIDALKKVNMYQDRKKMLEELPFYDHKQIAIAKALADNPKIIICDKPTVFLDFQSGIMIMRLLKEIAKQGISIVIVNHDKRYNDFVDRSVDIKNGEVNEK